MKREAPVPVGDKTVQKVVKRVRAVDSTRSFSETTQHSRAAQHDEAFDDSREARRKTSSDTLRPMRDTQSSQAATLMQRSAIFNAQPLSATTQLEQATSQLEADVSVENKHTI
jgi:hypothetical protein